MKHYIGIDLGTSNSAIATFDGRNVRLWKSPEQNDVTPSAILYQRRGGRLVGKKAYDSAPRYEDAAALRFKRLMGTGTLLSLPSVGLTLTPETVFRGDPSDLVRLPPGRGPRRIRERNGDHRSCCVQSDAEGRDAPGS